MKIEELYDQWCKETKRGGAILIGGSIRDFFKWLETNNYQINKLVTLEPVINCNMHAAFTFCGDNDLTYCSSCGEQI